MRVKAHAKREEARVRGLTWARHDAALLSPKMALTAMCGGCSMPNANTHTHE